MFKRVFSMIALLAGAALCYADEYVDHRGHNLDSLERVVARWTPVSIDRASDEELKQLIKDYTELMDGYVQANRVKSMYYANRVLKLAVEKNWPYYQVWGNKILGQHYWASEQYDSAAFFYSRALDGIAKMEVGESYTQREKDNALSAMYGTIGNLYSIQDSLELAMDYYGKALEIFKRNNWITSCAVSYYNMAETLMDYDTEAALGYYKEALACARETNDSLWIANAYKGIGEYYLSKGKASKALRYLAEADEYFSIHEDEELIGRMETLDFTSQMLRLQKNRMRVGIIVGLVMLVLLAALGFGAWLLRRSRREQKATAEVLDETLEELRPAASGRAGGFAAPELTDRERQILELICAGLTNPQIAEKIFLSPETIKWYRKKLLVKFDVVNSAELVRVTTESHIV